MELIITLVVAIVFFIGFYNSLIKLLIHEIVTIFSLINKGVNTKGKIIDIKEIKDSDNSSTYKPIIEYEDSSGLKYYRSTIYGLMRRPVLGREIRIRYDPFHPNKSFINTSGNYLLIFLLLIVTSIVLFILFIAFNNVL